VTAYAGVFTQCGSISCKVRVQLSTPGFSLRQRSSTRHRRSRRLPPTRAASSAVGRGPSLSKNRRTTDTGTICYRKSVPKDKLTRRGARCHHFGVISPPLHRTSTLLSRTAFDTVTGNQFTCAACLVPSATGFALHATAPSS
jgi:hypothetical protein